MAEVKSKKKKSSNLEVFCRIRNYAGDDGCAEIIGEDQVRLVPPINAPLNRRGEPQTCTTYQFAHVFEPNETQRAVFETAALDLTEGLISGQNSLLFTYGVTGSGKTFTMTGSAESDDSGIIPRCADVIFNSLKNQQEKCVFAPNGRNGFYIRSADEALAARRMIAPPEYNISSRIADHRRVYGFNPDLACAVFISYVEIYNDNCYDLLDESLTENRLNMTKNIRTDTSGVNFVDKLCEVEVSSSEDVFEEYLKAQERRKVASTLLNESSSRSHSVFTIRLVAAPMEDNSNYPVQDENKVTISQLCLVDLAGSERSKRTENQGQRIVESGKINQSLLVLRRCFEQLRENQRRKANLPIPYREQKLTQLFKSYFDGHGKIRMIVCVNPRPQDYEENVFVMSFAELAQAVDVPEQSLRQVQCSVLGEKYSHRQVNRWYTDLQRLLCNVSECQESLGRAPPIQLRSMSDEESVRNMREYYTMALKLHEGKLTKAKASEEDVRKQLFARLCAADLDRRLNAELESERDELRMYNATISKERNELKRTLASTKLQLSKYEADVQNYRRRDDEDRRRQIQQSEALMKQRETMKTIAAGLSIQPTTPRGTKVAELAEIFDENRPQANSQRDAKPPISRPKQFVRGPGGQYKPFVGGNANGVLNPRYRPAHRRSRSLNSRVLNHQPANKIPTGTIFQPELPSNAKTSTKVRAQDLRKCTDYVVTNQSVDDAGNLSTQHFKGDIIPTAAGGRAVLFRDVEKLTQESP